MEEEMELSLLCSLMVNHSCQLLFFVWVWVIQPRCIAIRGVFLCLLIVLRARAGDMDKSNATVGFWLFNFLIKPAYSGFRLSLVKLPGDTSKDIKYKTFLRIKQKCSTICTAGCPASLPWMTSISQTSTLLTYPRARRQISASYTVLLTPTLTSDFCVERPRRDFHTEIRLESYYLISHQHLIHVLMWGPSPDGADILYAHYLQNRQLPNAF